MAQEFRVGTQAPPALSPGSGLVRLRPAGIPGGDAGAHGSRREALVSMQHSRCAIATRSRDITRYQIFVVAVSDKKAPEGAFLRDSLTGLKIVRHTKGVCFGVITGKRGTAIAGNNAEEIGRAHV